MASSKGHSVPNQAPALLSVIWSLDGLAAVVLALRVYTRIRISRLGWDDQLMVLSWLSSNLFATFLTISAHYGLGKHIADLTPENAVQAMRWDFTGQAWGILTPMFGRISFCVTLFSLVGTSKLKKQLLWFNIVVQVLAGVSTVILIYVQCGSKLSALWDPKVRATAHCWSANVQTYYGFFQSAVNSATDLFLTIMPIWILWNVQIQTRFKVALICLLGLSVFALVASIVKCYEIKNLGKRNDFTWNTATFFTWVAVEIYVVIIAASIPALKPLFTLKKLSSRGQNSYEMYNSRTVGNNRSRGDGYIMHSESRENKVWAMNSSRTKESEASSEDNIIPMQNDNPYAIKKTMDVDVTISTSPPSAKSKTHSRIRSGDEDVADPFPFAHPDDRV